MASDVRIPKLLRVRELATLTGLPRWRIYEMIEQGKAPPFLRIGSTFRFSEDAVVQWIAEQSTATKKEE